MERRGVGIPQLATSSRGATGVPTVRFTCSPTRVAGPGVPSDRVGETRRVGDERRRGDAARLMRFDDAPIHSPRESKIIRIHHQLPLSDTPPEAVPANPHEVAQHRDGVPREAQRGRLTS